MSYRLSDAAKLLQGQPMFKILSRIKEMERAGEHIVHFEIGDPDFSSPTNVIKACEEALENGYTHYSDSMGDYEFRKAIAENNMFTRGFKPDISQVLVTPGANIMIYYAVRCLVNPGDVENAITEKTRLIIVNSPHNPTGAVMRKEELEAIANIALKHKVFLYLDEIYSRMNWGETSFFSPSIVDSCKDYMILANGFSKAFAMTGWRLGVGIGPSDVIEKMGLLLQTTSSCVPSFIQQAGIEAIRGDQSQVKQMMAEYKKRRDILVAGLNEIDKIQCLNPGGAFYVFPNIKATGLTSAEFTKRLLEEAKVGVCSGRDFGEAGEGYIRLCYATSEDEIVEGVRRIKQFVYNL